MNSRAAGISLWIWLAMAPAMFAQGSSSPDGKGVPPASGTAGKTEKSAPLPPAKSEKAGEKKAPTTSDAAGKPPTPPEKLCASDAAEVQAYADQLKSAGLTSEDVKTLVREETEERLAAKHMAPSTAGTAKGGNATVPIAPNAGNHADPGQGMKAFVQSLLAQGLHGPALADAIHTELARRHAAKSPAAPPPAAKSNERPGHAKAPGSPLAKSRDPKRPAAGSHGGPKPGKNEGPGKDHGKGSSPERPGP